MNNLYTTQQVADLFSTNPVKISYLRTTGKLPAFDRIKRRSFLYSQNDIVKFIIDAHSGKYPYSSFDVISALKKLQLDDPIILPETKAIITTETLYTTQQVADLFHVKNETIHYWRKDGKLPASSKIACRSFLYSQSNIVKFIEDTHSGKYANSSIDVISALKKLKLDVPIILPETNRLKSLSRYYTHTPKSEKRKYVYRVKPETDNEQDPHSGKL